MDEKYLFLANVCSGNDFGWCFYHSWSDVLTYQSIKFAHFMRKHERVGEYYVSTEDTYADPKPRERVWLDYSGECSAEIISY